MKKYQKRIKEWAICHRKDLFTHGHNTNNIVESSIRIFKDIVLVRCKAFNSAALVDFIYDVLENYHTRRLIKYATYRVTNLELCYKKCIKKAEHLQVSVDGDVYNVTSSTQNCYYTVRSLENYVEKIVPQFDDEQFKSHFRFLL